MPFPALVQMARPRRLPMLGFKNFESAVVAIAGVELLRRIHKNQFALSRLKIKGQAAPAIWNDKMPADLANFTVIPTCVSPKTLDNPTS